MPCKTCRHMTPVYQLFECRRFPQPVSVSPEYECGEFMRAVTVVPAPEPQPEPAVNPGGEEWPEPSYPLEEPPSPRRRRRRR
jgi:hypothetical protein